MATDVKIPFGISSDIEKTIDWHRSVQRILSDLKSDFVYAPHLRFIYKYAGDELIANIKSKLKDGAYAPGVPIGIEVPKTNRMRTLELSRVGPVFSRRGSILLPHDRLLYQAFADVSAKIVDDGIDASRSFSHQLAGKKSDAMFLPSRHNWSLFQKALRKRSKLPNSKYVLRTDIADYFGNINQHILINALADAGLPSEIARRLEILLISYTGERSSRGILQGMYPSDLFGNFYLSALDSFLDDEDRTSARYVDDIYIFVGSAKTAETVTRDIIQQLRGYDLSLNESKSVLMPANYLLTEEPDLESLFQSAVDEISEQIKDDEFDTDYGFQSDWDEDEFDEEDAEALELKATIALLDSVDDYPNQEENIQRFCLPLLASAYSDYAIDTVIDSFRRHPSMTQQYCSYLVRFVGKSNVLDFLTELAPDDSLMDWQRMWILATLLSAKDLNDEIVKIAAKIYKNKNSHEALRATAAMLIGKFGSHARRKRLISSYADSGSTYVQSAIYYSSQSFSAVEKQNAKSSWGNQNDLNRLITKAFENKKKPLSDLI